jgi:hypothetical protein
LNLEAVSHLPAESARGWTDRIRAHPNVRLVTVGKDNRDDLPAKLAQMIRSEISSY